MYYVINELSRYGIKYGCQCTIEGLNENVLMKLKSTGCIFLELGLETRDLSILKILKKNSNIQKIIDNIKLAKHIMGIESIEISSLNFYNKDQ